MIGSHRVVRVTLEAVEKPSEARSWPSVDRPEGSEGAEFGRLRPDLQRSEGHFWIAIDFFNSLDHSAYPVCRCSAWWTGFRGAAEAWFGAILRTTDQLYPVNSHDRATQNCALLLGCR